MVKGASGVGGGTVIVVKSSYEYKPALMGYLWGSSTWTEEAIVTPRNNCVAFGDTCDMSSLLNFVSILSQRFSRPRWSKNCGTFSA